MSGYETDTVTRIETNLDDLSPQIVGAVLGKLFEAGALDAWVTPIQMKKNRPGIMLSALCEEAAVAALTDVIFSETSAFGLRIEKVQRLKLARRFETVATRFGDVVVKLGLRGGRVIQIAPEFESCVSVARHAGVPLRDVQAAAAEAARARVGDGGQQPQG